MTRIEDRVIADSGIELARLLAWCDEAQEPVTAAPGLRQSGTDDDFERYDRLVSR